jgi:hypothetical protein
MLACPRRCWTRFGWTPQNQGSACVPEIVPTNKGETRALEERLEVAVDDVLSVEGSTFAGGEYETVLLLVGPCPNPS